MSTIIRESNPVARKRYYCGAADWIINSEIFRTCTFTEKKQIIIASRSGWMINKGDKYYQQVNIFSGDFGVFKAMPALNDICIKYDLYQED